MYVSHRIHSLPYPLQKSHLFKSVYSVKSVVRKSYPGSSAESQSCDSFKAGRQHRRTLGHHWQLCPGNQRIVREVQLYELGVGCERGKICDLI